VKHPKRSSATLVAIGARWEGQAFSWLSVLKSRLRSWDIPLSKPPHFKAGVLDIHFKLHVLFPGKDLMDGSTLPSVYHIKVKIAKKDRTHY